MLADAATYQQLQQAKESEKRAFEQALAKCRQEHENKVYAEKE
jgi:hypothetical protein